MERPVSYKTTPLLLRARLQLRWRRRHERVPHGHRGLDPPSVCVAECLCRRFSALGQAGLWGAYKGSEDQLRWWVLLARAEVRWGARARALLGGSQARNATQLRCPPKTRSATGLPGALRCPAKTRSHNATQRSCAARPKPTAQLDSLVRCAAWRKHAAATQLLTITLDYVLRKGAQSNW